ncbi:Vacuolar protein sorting-associated protein 18 -like protein [Halotydeus destructor]|nr:Vacuolar protein sorting-associated protein 18 -like protein [Halotydeus destructor]
MSDPLGASGRVASPRLDLRNDYQFEKTALELMRCNDQEELKNFLASKLDLLSDQDVTQVTLLVMWMLEIILNQLNKLRNSRNELGNEYKMLVEEFRSLVRSPKIKSCLKRNIRGVKDLISSHGDDENMIFFALQIEDFECAIEYFLKLKRYMEALEVLRKKENIPLLYMFAPVLIYETPFKFIDVCIFHGEKIDISRLLPALVQRFDGRAEIHKQIIRYLEFSLNQLKRDDKTMANYLLTLYAQMDESKLQTYLERQGDEESTINYDLPYVLRICLELNLRKACIHLYVTKKLYEEAVDLALSENLKLAKRIADTPESDDTKKQLWLKVARRVIGNKKDITQVKQLLNECSLLKIEDMLPFLDFVTIENLKDPICASLKVYKENKESLKHESKEAMENIDELKEQMSQLRSRHAVVRADDLCTSCQYSVISRSFYVFPCLHIFHSDCLMSSMRPHLKESARLKIDELSTILSVTQPVKSSQKVNDVAHFQLMKQKAAVELDDIIGSECPSCGEIMIKSIDRPFLDANDHLASSGWD